MTNTKYSVILKLLKLLNIEDELNIQTVTILSALDKYSVQEIQKMIELYPIFTTIFSKETFIDNIKGERQWL